MSTVNELRTQRAKSWEKANAFLIAHRDGKGILSAVDTATYEAMEQEIVNLGREIERQERLDAMEREMAVPVSTPLTSKPEAAKPTDTKVGRASDAYKKAFWNVTRHKDRITPEMRNALQEGTDSEGGYLVPDLHPDKGNTKYTAQTKEKILFRRLQNGLVECSSESREPQSNLFPYLSAMR